MCVTYIAHLLSAYRKVHTLHISITGFRHVCVLALSFQEENKRNESGSFSLYDFYECGCCCCCCSFSHCRVIIIVVVFHSDDAAYKTRHYKSQETLYTHYNQVIVKTCMFIFTSDTQTLYIDVHPYDAYPTFEYLSSNFDVIFLSFGVYLCFFFGVHTLIHSVKVFSTAWHITNRTE